MKDRVGMLNRLVTLTNCLLGFIALIGGFLVLAGYSHRIGYLNSFGINVGVLPTQLYESLGQAFYIGFVFANDLLRSLGWFLFGILLFTMGMVIIFGIVKWRGSAEKEVQILTWLEKFSAESKKPKTWQRCITVVFEELRPMVSIVCIIVFVLTLICGPLIKSYRIGNEEGERQLQKYRDLNFDCSRLAENVLNCIQIVNIETGQIVGEGLSVSGESDSYIALHNGENIEVFSSNSNHKVVIHPTITNP